MASTTNTIARMLDIAKASKDLDNDAQSRATLLQLSRQVTTALQQPDEVVSLVAFSHGLYLCARLAVDLDIFKLICEKPRSAQELSTVTGADEVLLSRILRTLTGMGWLNEEKKNEYAANAVTYHMTKASPAAGIRYIYDDGMTSLAKAPEYFKKNGYKLPEGSQGLYQYSFETTDDAYAHSMKRPGVMENFNIFMQDLFGTPNRLGWSDWFPFDKVCLAGFDPKQSPYVFVDVGGGHGYQAEVAFTKWPTTGKFAVQDQAAVIGDITRLNPQIERQVHDFLTPQPIKGARVYFLQNIMHNWADSVCLQILSHIRDAMTPGYSKALLVNLILPEENVPLRASGLDLAMLYLYNGTQRNETQWRALVESAQLRVVKFWYPGGDGDGVVEVERPL